MSPVTSAPASVAVLGCSPSGLSVGCKCPGFFLGGEVCVCAFPVPLACTWLLNNFWYPRYKAEVEELHIGMFFLADQSFERDPLSAGKHHVRALKGLWAGWLAVSLDNKDSR